MNSRTLTKIQSVALLAVVVTGLVGVAAYVILGGQDQASETIKIGIATNLDTGYKQIWQGAVLAAEEVNAEGGVLGRQFEIVVEDDPGNDPLVSKNALDRLISHHKANFIFGGSTIPFTAQERCADENIILFCGTYANEFTQRIVEDYDRYKGSFRAGLGNETSATYGIADSLLTLRNYTGFNKVAILTPSSTQIYSGVRDYLGTQEFDIVYQNSYATGTVDFTSYFAAIEASEAEILLAYVKFGAVPFVKEYHDRQSPFIIWGDTGGMMDKFWEETGGKCEFASFAASPVVAGYPITSKTLPFREAYIERWGEKPNQHAAIGYDLVRFILVDAIRRAGTIETESMVAALEETDIETTMTRRHVYTSDHDIMVGEAGPNRPDEDYLLVCLFQWQNGVPVPVYPQGIMEEGGATYMYPPWSGPWD